MDVEKIVKNIFDDAHKEVISKFDEVSKETEIKINEVLAKTYKQFLETYGAYLSDSQNEK